MASTFLQSRKKRTLATLPNNQQPWRSLKGETLSETPDNQNNLFQKWLMVAFFANEWRHNWNASAKYICIIDFSYDSYINCI